MPGKTRIILIIAILLVLLASASGAGFLRTQGQTIVDSSGNEVLFRGLGLGGWLVPEGYMLDIPGYGSPTSIKTMITEMIGEELTAEFYELYEQNYVAEEDIELIAEWGFNSIRIPFHYQLLTSLDLPTEFKEEGFQLLDTLLAWCGRNELYLILDLHCAPGGQNDGNISDSQGQAELWSNSFYQDLTVAIWRKVAEHYVDEPWIGGYDLLNEPVLYGEYSNIDLRSLYLRITQAIREVDQNHIIFIEGNWYATDFYLLSPPFDSNMVYAFHKYWSATDKNSIQQYLNLSQTYQVPLWVGEFGENSNHWAQTTIDLLEQYGIGWNWWTHKKLSTITSPLSANINPGYQDLLDYWRGEAEMPAAATAYASLMEMAANLALDKCELHPDVLHAITEPVGSVLPYAVNILPGDLPVQNYDMGLNGLAYSDTEYEKTHWDRDEPWNLGYTARSDGVDLERVDDQSGNFNIGWIADQEWINYTVDIQRGGTYQITLETAAPSDYGQIAFKLDDTPLISGIKVPNTGDYHKWSTISAGPIELQSGTHQLKIIFERGGFNLKSMRFDLVNDSTYIKISNDIFLGNNYPNPFNSATAIPIVLNRSQRITAEIFNLQGLKVTTLYDGILPNGLNELTWYGTADSSKLVSSGTYFVRITVGGQTINRKISLVR